MSGARDRAMKDYTSHGYVTMELTLPRDELAKVLDLLPNGTPILKNAIDLYHVARKDSPLHLTVGEAGAIFDRLATPPVSPSEPGLVLEEPKP
jgi:hypothetical protein